MAEKSKRELLEIAKQLNITGRHKMTKEELIDEITKKSSDVETQCANEIDEVEVESEGLKSDEDDTTCEEREVESEDDKDDGWETGSCDNEKIDIEFVVNGEKRRTQGVTQDKKEQFIRTMKAGYFVVFRVNGDQYRMAKAVGRNEKRKLIKLVGRNGMEFVILYEDVIWVSQSKSLPRAIRDLLEAGRERGKTNHQ